MGSSHNSVLSWEKRDARIEVGLGDRRTLKFQFLNTRRQGTISSQPFSQEIGCSLSCYMPTFSKTLTSFTKDMASPTS